MAWKGPGGSDAADSLTCCCPVFVCLGDGRPETLSLHRPRPDPHHHNPSLQWLASLITNLRAWVRILARAIGMRYMEVLPFLRC